MVAGPSFIALIVLVLCLAGLTALWFRVISQAKPDLSRCGGCGYAVEGLETMCCPECGGDLREVGILPSAARRIRPGVFIALWTLLLPLPALLVSAIVVQLVPRHQAVAHNISIAPNSMSFPQMMLLVEYQGSTRSRLGFSGASISSRSDGTRTTTSLTFPTIGGGTAEIKSAELRVAPTGGFRSIGPGTAPVGPVFSLPTEPGASVDPAKLTNWLRAQATTPGDEEMLALDAADLADLASGLIGGTPSYTTSRLLVSGSGSSSGRARWPTWVIAIVVGFWTLVYAGGCVLFVAIRRRGAVRSAAS